jgi:hypothetical protein
VRPLFVPPRRAIEAVTADQLVATGSIGGWGGVDPVDGDTGYRPAGAKGLREVPWWTAEKARIYAVNAYRANPMARAVVDTFTSFCVGDAGVTYTVTNPEVRAVVDEFWTDPKNLLGTRQALHLRSHLIMGESLWKMMVGPYSGVVRYCPIDVGRIGRIEVESGNPLWPAQAWLDVSVGSDGGIPLDVVQVDDLTGLRTGEAIYWASFKALDTDIRGYSFLGPILDQLDSYDTVLSNLIDRTALARYLVWDVEVQGDQAAVDRFVADRGGLHVPPSGAVEVHNENVKWTPQTATTGAEQDTVAAQSVLTQIAGGSGLSKHWLAEPEGANRATSHTMAEPVRRRVAGVQQLWIGYQTELIRFVVDRAVSAGRLPRTVQATDPQTGQSMELSAAQTVTVSGPEIAAADAQITATVLMNISTALQQMVEAGVLSQEASRVAAKKAWQDYMGIPYTADLDSPEANPDDVATAVDDSTPPTPPGAAVPISEALKRRGDPERLHQYWVAGEGLAKWADTPKPWTALHAELAKYMPDEEAKKTAAQWFHEVMGFWPGADLNRVTHGKPPRGKKVGPG